MKIQITAGGIFGGDGKEIPVGTEFDLKEEPVGWAGRYTVLQESKGGKTALHATAPTDPVKAELEKHTVDELKKIATDEKIDLGEATAKGDMIAAILKSRAEKAA